MQHLFEMRPGTADSREDITALPDRPDFEKRAVTPLPPPLQQPRPRTPTHHEFEKRPDTGDSVEDITALPFSKELRTSPHLRPATQDTADIPYDWNLQTASHHSLPVTRERGKLQRNPSRNKRAAYDPPLAKRKPSKKRKDEHLREEEIRAMSAPINIPRKAGRNDSGLLRRDSKKMRGGLNKHLERPMSNISLPLEESIHSSMSAASESRNYRLSVLDIVAPRPTMRYTVQNPYSIYAQPSRGESRATRPPTSKSVLRERARVDSLADELGSTELRELMDRDKRRKEKKRKTDIEKVQRKLQKRYEKQRAKDFRDEDRAAAVTPTAPPKARSHSKTKAEAAGLGIAASTSKAPEHPLRKHPVDEPDAQAGAEPTFHMEDIEETGAAVPVAPELTRPTNRFGSEEIPRMPLLSSHGGDDDERRTLETPFEELEIQLGVSGVDATQPVLFSQGHPSRTTSPLYPGDRAKASQVLGQDVAMGDYSKVSKVLGENVPRPSSSTPPPNVRRESAPQEKKRSGMWSSLFRRDRKSSAEPSRDSRSETSFSNTSRDSMSRHVPPTHLYQPPSNTARSGTPARTMSKFREDLPELPLSPPDSRVQSPEATSSGAMAIATRRGVSAPSGIQTDAPARRSSGPYGDLTSRGRTESPASGEMVSNIMSQSLASVDSEASWLSGRPHRISSLSRKHNSTGNQSAGRAADDFSTSYEELGIPDDEYFRRLHPHQGEVRHSSGLSAAMRVSHKASSSAIAAGSAVSDTDDELRSSPPRPKQEGETVVHTGASRQPTVVHRESRVRSSEGLLNQYLDADAKAEGAYITPQDSPIKERHDEDQTSSVGVEATEK